MNPDYINALVGGAIIGLAVTMMLLFNGRVTGISGILNGTFTYQKGDWAWRVAFFGGLLAGGTLVRILSPESFADMSNRSVTSAIVAGLLVGFGTVMGSGCTSGHGVCGMSRLSIRSIAATVTFMAAGFLTVYLFNKFVGV